MCCAPDGGFYLACCPEKEHKTMGALMLFDAQGRTVRTSLPSLNNIFKNVFSYRFFKRTIFVIGLIDVINVINEIIYCGVG